MAAILRGVTMLGFEPEKDNLKEDKDFEDSIWKKLGYSKYLCPTCSAHLKESMDTLICLNACHLPNHWQKRFNKQMQDVVKQKGEKQQSTRTKVEVS